MQDPGLTRVAEAISRYRRFLVTSHIHPDGDNIGSLLGMTWLLGRLGKEGVPVNSDPVPAAFSFLPGVEKVLLPSQYLEKEEGVEAVIVLDAGDLARVGETACCFPAEAPLIIIDHHPQTIREDCVVYVRPEAAATGELVFDLIQFFGVPLDQEGAVPLYTAIFTDTGGFRFSNTSERVLRLAAELVRYGADPALIAEQVYETRPLAALKLLGEALRSLKVSRDGQVAWMVISQEMLRDNEVGPEETDGFVNYARMVKGVRVAVLLRDLGNGEIKVSWRSRRGTDVSLMARAMGGGGHVNAAGSIYKGELEVAVQEVLAVISRLLPAKI